MPFDLFPLGSQGLKTPRMGLGIMSAAFYGSGDSKADEEAQLSALDKLVELAAPSPAFIDTAWLYSHPTGLHSEEIVGKGPPPPAPEHPTPSFTRSPTENFGALALAPLPAADMAVVGKYGPEG